MQVCVDGQFLSAGEPVIRSNNPSYRFGDGLFETVCVWRGQIVLADFHFERLWNGMKMLDISPSIERTTIEAWILETCLRNGCAKAARVRLSVSMSPEQERSSLFVVEAQSLDAQPAAYNEDGLRLFIYEEGWKAADKLANLKSSSAILYRQAARFAGKRGGDEALVMNHRGNLIESQVANLFIVKNDEVITPPLSEGCIAGVMRRFILEEMRGWWKQESLQPVESPISPAALSGCSEIFLTNAIRPVRWVGEIGSERYTHNVASRLYREIISRLRV
jgi:branched-chain amino acid aminotransferase